jgi:periplasmic protein TonB
MSGLFSILIGMTGREYCRKILLPALLVAASFFPFTLLAQDYITNGVGAYTEFSETTLLIRLELEAPATDPVEVMAVDTNKKLSFRIMQNRSPRAWSKIWIQNLSINNSSDTLSTQTNDLIAMTQVLQGTLRTGDLVEFERVASDLTIMSINGHEMADFETTGFFEFLMTAFIGSIPPSSGLKNNLLAGGNLSGDASILFGSLDFTQERAAQIAGWVSSAVVADTPDSDTEAESSSSTAEEESGQETEQETEIASTEETTEPEASTDTSEIATDPAPDTSTEVASSTMPDVADEDEDEDAPVMLTAESLMATQNYQRSVLRGVYQELEYPSSAQRRNREGSLRLSIAINANGAVSKIEVTESAQYDVLDEAAIEAIEQASPFEPLPQGTMEVPMVLEIPIAFRLQ